MPAKIDPAAGAENLGKSIFNTDGRRMLDVAIAYQLTGNTDYAEKVLQVIRPLADPETRWSEGVMRFPLGTTKHFSLLASRRVGGQYGMQFEKWGNLEGNSVGIKDMWDAAVPFINYRGVLPAINDALDAKVSGKSYELAYYLYRDPEYAAIINRGNGRDLLYGVPDLPDVTSEKARQSAYADNMGIVQLRSQAKGVDYYGGPIKIAGETMANFLPGMPHNAKEVGTVTVDLSGLDGESCDAKITVRELRDGKVIREEQN